MSLEDKISELVAALNANTAALGGKAGSAPAGGTKTGTKPPADDKSKTGGPKHSVEQTAAVVLKINTEFGMKEAKAVLKKFGLEKTAQITDETSDKVFAAATSRYAELSAEPEDEPEPEDEDGGI